MEPAVVSVCSLGEKEAAAAPMENPKHTDTRPLANAFCFAGSSPTPGMCSQRTERQTAPGDQATPSGKTRREKVSSSLLEKEGHALEQRGLKSRERRRPTNTTENSIIQKQPFPQGPAYPEGKVVTRRHITAPHFRINPLPGNGPLQ